MRSKRAFVIASVSLLLIPIVALAHHALEAQFNTKETIALTGIVKRMDWSNPHVRLYIEVKDESNAVTWEVEMGSPNKQLAAGWKIDTYRHGDVVRVEAYPARNGSNVAYGRRVTPSKITPLGWESASDRVEIVRLDSPAVEVQPRVAGVFPCEPWDSVQSLARHN